MRIEHARFLHFEPQIVAFARSLADARKHRHAAMFQSDVVDQLHDDDGLADARAAEQADLSAAQIRLQQIDHLDAGLEHLQLGGLLVKGRRRRDEWTISAACLDGTHVVHRLADDVHHAAQRLVAHRNFDAMAQAYRLHPAHHAVGGLQCDGAHAAFADVLRHFRHHVDRHRGSEAFARDVHGGVDHRNLVFGKLNVDGRSGHLDHFAFYLVAVVVAINSTP